MQRIIQLSVGLAAFCASGAASAQEVTGFGTAIDQFFGYIVAFLVEIIFFDLLPGEPNLPLAVAWLVAGAVYFTFRMGFVNIRLFRHAIDCVRGRFDNPKDLGEVTHFQALTAALSATVGLGNIAGVAIAVGTGGPGAVFWMILAGFLGMTAKFVEVTLGQMYREVRPDGRIMGGAMEYLSRGLAEQGLPRFGKVLAIVFSVFCIFGSFGGGNAFQVSQSLAAVKQQVPMINDYPILYGIVMAILVGLVIIGGITRIAKVTQALVPSMCGLYVLASLWIIFVNVDQVPHALAEIVRQAFSPDAAFGGFLGVLVIGFKRAAFSNEAGIGSAPIAHSAARTKYPVREGVVALLEPFVDTIVVCTMTALVIVITGMYNHSDPAIQELVKTDQGAALTSAAFATVISWYPLLLSVSVVLFAYSTMISWSYYGERCWSYLFGDGAALLYRIAFVIFVVLGSVVSAANILTFSDLMILSMAFPNILGLYLLQKKVIEAKDAYLAKFRAGEFEKEIVAKTSP